MNINYNEKRKEARQIKVNAFTKIFVQEYLRNYRAEIIIQKISEKYLIPKQTIRSYIKSSHLKNECESGKHTINSKYISIVK